MIGSVSVHMHINASGRAFKINNSIVYYKLILVKSGTFNIKCAYIVCLFVLQTVRHPPDF